MNVIPAFSLFSVIILIYWIIAEFFTIDLYYVKGYSMPQMAEIMGISSAEGVELLDEAMKAFKRTSILRG